MGTELRDKGHKSPWGQVKDRTKSLKKKEKLKRTKEGRLRILRTYMAMLKRKILKKETMKP